MTKTNTTRTQAEAYARTKYPAGALFAAAAVGYEIGHREGATTQLAKDIAIVERIGAKQTLAAPVGGPVRYGLLTAFTDAREALVRQEERQEEPGT